MGTQVLEYVNAQLCLISWLMLFSSQHSRIAPSPPFPFITSQPNLSIRPVVLFKDSFIILHGSISDQHDGLVTQASLASISELQTERESTAYPPQAGFGELHSIYSQWATHPDFHLQTSHCSERGLCLHDAYRFFIFTALPGTCRHRRLCRSKIRRRK